MKITLIYYLQESDKREKIFTAGIVIVASGRQRNRMIDTGDYVKPKEIAFCFVAKSSICSNFNDLFVEGQMDNGSWWYSLPSLDQRVFFCFCTPLYKNDKNTHLNSKLLDAYKKTQLLRGNFGQIKIKQILRTRWSDSTKWSKIMGKKWIAIGDAAYSHHPLNGRGIDFSIISAKMVSDVISSEKYEREIKEYSNWLKNYIHVQSSYEHIYLSH